MAAKLPKTLALSGNPDADKLLTEDPMALLIGMVLDQQIPLEWAFHGPYELQSRLGQRLEDLPIQEQQLLHLRFFEHLDVKVIAEKLGITVEALRMRQARALRHLRALMVDDGRRN